MTGLRELLDQSLSSLAALNFMLVRPFDRLRFRPNLIVDTKGEAFAETNWAGLLSVDVEGGLMVGDSGLQVDCLCLLQESK